MHLVEAVFVNNEVLPGWFILKEEIPLGRVYLVDLDRQRMANMTHLETGHTIRVPVVWVESPGTPGFMPKCALQLRALDKRLNEA